MQGFEKKYGEKWHDKEEEIRGRQEAGEIIQGEFAEEMTKDDTTSKSVLGFY